MRHVFYVRGPASQVGAALAQPSRRSRPGPTVCIETVHSSHSPVLKPPRPTKDGAALLAYETLFGPGVPVVNTYGHPY